MIAIDELEDGRSFKCEELMIRALKNELQKLFMFRGSRWRRHGYTMDCKALVINNEGSPASYDKYMDMQKVLRGRLFRFFGKNKKAVAWVKSNQYLPEDRSTITFDQVRDYFNAYCKQLSEPKEECVDLEEIVQENELAQHNKQ